MPGAINRSIAHKRGLGTVSQRGRQPSRLSTQNGIASWRNPPKSTPAHSQPIRPAGVCARNQPPPPRKAMIARLSHTAVTAGMEKCPNNCRTELRAAARQTNIR